MRAVPLRTDKLAVPTADVASHTRESLSATGVTKPAHAANHRVLERRGVVPPLARQLCPARSRAIGESQRPRRTTAMTTTRRPSRFVQR